MTHQNQPPKTNYTQNSLVKVICPNETANNESKSWMVIVLKGKAGKEKARILISGVSEKVAKSYQKGFNQSRNDSAKTRIQAVSCRCH